LLVVNNDPFVLRDADANFQLRFDRSLVSNRNRPAFVSGLYDPRNADNPLEIKYSNNSLVESVLMRST